MKLCLLLLGVIITVRMRVHIIIIINTSITLKTNISVWKHARTHLREWRAKRRPREALEERNSYTVAEVTQWNVMRRGQTCAGMLDMEIT
ncbi:AAEL001181-PA [Aedes aegypti]|uniref:AAEL001181-PA n=1 Tax=Aedes aegypti TaxID=7159 RepID=Q17M05_AEDAE|nr:AAEL001181-PA [Aedes aegypti]